MADIESICARMCLLTRAAWRPELPPPLTRPMARRLIASGALCGLVLRTVPGVDDGLLERSALLLSRARAVSQCLEAYRAAGYEVLLPKDALWPQRLYALGEQMPLLLFVRGEKALLLRRAVAVAGSRHVSAQTLERARRVGAALAREGVVMVCGGAQGVDDAAQRALLREGGRLMLVPARPVEPLCRQEAIADALADGRLLLVCDALPDDPFSPQKAIARNHTIYALGGAAVVLAAREGVGGSWHGATDCLRGGYAKVFVPGEELSALPGSAALHARGAQSLDLDRPLVAQLFSHRQTSLFSGDGCGMEADVCR